MAWLEITLNTADADVEDVAAALTAQGFSDLVVEDQSEFEEFLEQNRSCWDYIDEKLQKELQGLSRIKLYLSEEETARLARLERFAAQEGLPMDVKPLEETDWSESWKQNYPPVPVGKGLVILPCWLDTAPEDGRTPIILNPGLTFGTGEHPTTQLVLEAMEELVRPGFHCLDLGSGSGILSIAALRLGAADAVGVDIDPKAEDMARENAGYNGFSAPQFTALTGNVTADQALLNRLAQRDYDLVLVNIVADVILSLAPTLPAFLSKHSTLICSGILQTRLDEVRKGLEAAGLRVLQQRSREDWCCIIAKKE